MGGSNKIVRCLKLLMNRFPWIKHMMKSVIRYKQKWKLQHPPRKKNTLRPNPLEKANLFSNFHSGQFFSLHRPVKILAIKLDHLGDFLLALPALHALMEKVGPCELDLLIGSWNLSLAKQVKGVHQVFTFDFFKQQSKLPPELKEKALAELMAQLPEYDIAIDLRRFADTRFLLAAVRASYKIGYESLHSAIDKALDLVLPSTSNQTSVLTTSNQVHSSIQMLRLIEAIPFRIVKNPPLVLHPKKSDSIGIFPFSGAPVREWGLDHFHTLVTKLSSAYPDFVINLYLSRDRSCEVASFQKMPQIQIHSDLSLENLLEQVEKDQVIVSNDSFGAHLAYQVGASLVEIFSGIAPLSEFSAGFGPCSLLQNEVACSPCHISSKELCPYERQCLTHIHVDQVFDAVKYHLDHKTYQETRTLYYFTR
jgi:ADP-heptose:LPS heptosyltransferase